MSKLTSPAWEILLFAQFVGPKKKYEKDLTKSLTRIILSFYSYTRYRTQDMLDAIE